MCRTTAKGKRWHSAPHYSQPGSFMKLYENVVIGNFLYGLGFAMAKRLRGFSIPVSVNLLQQTPADQFLADVFIRAPGVLRIIEFKQAANRDDKEAIRHGKLMAGLRGNARLPAISRELHWFIETCPTENSVASRIVPYVDLFPRAWAFDEDILKFVEETADAAVKGKSACTEEEQDDYVRILALCHRTEETSAGGLVLRLDPQGILKFVSLQSLLDLRLSREQIHQREAQARIVHERTLTKGFER